MPLPQSGYSGTPLPKKLGIKPGTRVLLLDAPAELSAGLREACPETAFLEAAAPADLALWFTRSAADLAGRIEEVIGLMGSGLWICWPKKASGVVTDLSENLVRETGLAHGIVDFKVAAIDSTWSGLRFARRKH